MLNLLLLKKLLQLKPSNSSQVGHRHPPVHLAARTSWARSAETCLHQVVQTQQSNHLSSFLSQHRQH
jgi:hypothetical protein